MIIHEQQHLETPRGFKALLKQAHILTDYPARENLQSCESRLINSGIKEGLICSFCKQGIKPQHD